MLGTSAPLYGLLLAATGRALDPELIPQEAFILNVGADAAATVTLALLVREASGRRAPALVAAGLYVLSGRALDYSAGGMETPFTVLLLLLTLLAAARGEHVLAALWAALAAVHRPDGALLLLVVAGWTLLTAPRPALARSAALAALVVGAWCALATHEFGSPLPHSVVAKASPVYVHGEATLLAHFMAEFLNLAPGGLLVRGAGLHAAALLLNALLLALGFAALRRRSPAAWVPAAWALTYFAAFSWGDPCEMGWYAVPLMTVLSAFLAVGALEAASKLAPARPVVTTAAVGLALLAAQSLELRLLPGPALRWEAWQPRDREAAYRQAARVIEDRLGPGLRVAAPEIGALGWEGRTLRVLDTVGLVSPEALPHYPLPPEQLAYNNAVAPSLIEAERPDVVVAFELFISRSLLASPRFLADHVLVASAPAAFLGSGRLLIFKRKDL